MCCRVVRGCRRSDLERGEAAVGHGAARVRARHVERHRLRHQLAVCRNRRAAHRLPLPGTLFVSAVHEGFD